MPPEQLTEPFLVVPGAKPDQSSSESSATRSARSERSGSTRGWLARSPFDRRPRVPGQGRDDEVVRVLDQIAHQLVRERAVEPERVPVPLVHVIAGRDSRVRGAQLLGEVRLALDVHLERALVQPAEREYASADPEDRDFWPEREVLARAREGEAAPAERGDFHAHIIPDASFLLHERLPGYGYRSQERPLGLQPDNAPPLTRPPSETAVSVLSDPSPHG